MSTKESLPELNEWTLFYLPDGTFDNDNGKKKIIIGKMLENTKRLENDPEFIIMEYNQNCGYCATFYDLHQASHSMPLPKVPNEMD